MRQPTCLPSVACCVSLLAALSLPLRAQDATAPTGTPPPTISPSAPITSPVISGRPALPGAVPAVGPTDPTAAGAINPGAPAPLASPPPAATPGSPIDELGVELVRRRQAEELANDGNPNTPRTYRNQGNVPLRTLFLSLAKQSQIPYFEPPFADDPVVAFTAPEGIKPIDAFYAAADAYGFTVITKSNGFITLSRRDINIPQSYSSKTYPLIHLNPFFAAQPLAQSLGFQIKAPGQNSPSFPAPNTSQGSGGSLGGTTSGDDQSQPRFTPILPLDAPIYFRQHTGSGKTAQDDESYLFVDRKQKAFVLYGTPAEHRLIREYLSRLDRPEKLIRVHTEVYRVNRNRSDQLGIDWSGTTGGATFSLNSSFANASAFSFLPTGLLLSYPNVSATIHALVSKGLLRNISTTDLMLRDGIPNTIRQITEDPVVLTTGLTGNTTVNTGTGGATTGSTDGSNTGTSEVKTFYYGLSIDGVAFAMPGGKVDLNLNLALSQNTGDKQTSQGPIPVVQRNTTPVSAVVKPGTTFAFGGLVSGNEQTTRTAIPYLSKLPFLGKYFFASTTKTFTGDTLIVFATPWLIDSDATPTNPLTPDEIAAKDRIEANVGGFDAASEIRRAVPTGQGKDFTPFRRGVTKPVRSVVDQDMEHVTYPNN